MRANARHSQAQETQRVQFRCLVVVAERNDTALLLELNHTARGCSGSNLSKQMHGENVPDIIYFSMIHSALCLFFIMLLMTFLGVVSFLLMAGSSEP